MTLAGEVRRRWAGMSPRRDGPPEVAAESVRRWLAAVVAGRPAAVPVDAESIHLLRRSRLSFLAAFAPGGEEAFSRERRDAFAATVQIERATSEVVELLARASIPCVTLKGPAFAAQVIGDGARRSSLDVDVLVRRADLPAVRGAFALAGMTGAVHYPVWYEERWHDHVAYRGLPEAPALTVEVHWDIVRPGLSRLPIDEVLRGRVTVPCLSADLPAPELHWQMVFTAAHAAQHFYDARGLVDVALCAARLDEDGWRAAVEAARRARLGPALHHAVVRSAGWLGWQPPALVAGLRPGRSQTGLAGSYLARLDPWLLPSWGVLQLAKVGTPACVSARLAGLPGMLVALTDRPNVCTALDAAVRRRLGDGAAAGD